MILGTKLSSELTHEGIDAFVINMPIGFHDKERNIRYYITTHAIRAKLSYNHKLTNGLMKVNFKCLEIEYKTSFQKCTFSEKCLSLHQPFSFDISFISTLI